MNVVVRSYRMRIVYKGNESGPDKGHVVVMMSGVLLQGRVGAALSITTSELLQSLVDICQPVRETDTCRSSGDFRGLLKLNRRKGASKHAKVYAAGLSSVRPSRETEARTGCRERRSQSRRRHRRRLELSTDIWHTG